jgi:hypothetical protein
MSSQPTLQQSAEEQLQAQQQSAQRQQPPASLPGAGAGDVGLAFPSAAAGDFTLFSEPHILDGTFQNWDTIIHEYGHAVAQESGFMAPTSSWEHNVTVNQRTEHADEEQTDVLQIAFNEGFANYYSMAAQSEMGVSNPAVVGAGDPYYEGYQFEGADANGNGEDEELSVMRVLWDLADPVDTTENDRVEVGFQELFTVIDTNDIDTLDGLWDRLVDDAAGDAQKIADYGAIFEAHNAAPTALAMTVGGNPVTVVAGGAGAPEGRWDIPQGNPAVGSFAATGDVLNHFGVKVFDEYMVELLDTGFLPKNETAVPVPGEYEVVGTTAIWTPTAANWDAIRGAGAAAPGSTLTRYWVVYGGYQRTNDDPVTGPYWSDLRTIDVQW